MSLPHALPHHLLLCFIPLGNVSRCRLIKVDEKFVVTSCSLQDGLHQSFDWRSSVHPNVTLVTSFAERIWECSSTFYIDIKQHIECNKIWLSSNIIRDVQSLSIKLVPWLSARYLSAIIRKKVKKLIVRTFVLNSEGYSQEQYLVVFIVGKFWTASRLEFLKRSRAEVEGTTSARL